LDWLASALGTVKDSLASVGKGSCVQDHAFLMGGASDSAEKQLVQNCTAQSEVARKERPQTFEIEEQ
jgi:hypothetical protein